jgi:hypothetical protein
MVPFGLLGGVELSEGGMVVVVPGDVDWSVAGVAVDVSAGGELAEPAGDVDSCLEQADRSASEPTHNNRTLRFIRSPHYCNGTVTRGLSSESGPACRKVASGVPQAHARLPATVGDSANRGGGSEGIARIDRMYVERRCGVDRTRKLTSSRPWRRLSSSLTGPSDASCQRNPGRSYRDECEDRPYP